ncbi:NACHT domain-containing protein [Serratia marcescens]|uniref:NACHT domain-containing protein n=1 Tax=Serratia marcescens TaxID=615 RepID=UPI00217B3102|nr:NACHT domain-containing protein [Serratia marcescens]CAI1677511.1 Predicted NTPase (NACHT family) [Serratia marcescens]
MDILFQELTKAGVAIAVKELFGRIVATWDNKNLNARQLVRELNGQDGYMNYLVKHVSRVVRLRTIHSAEHDVFLNDLYHPLRITSILPTTITHNVNDEFYIENQQITNIIGIAGQGKSTILRKLFIEQVNNGNKIPFFIELRRIEKSGILLSLQKTLANLGLQSTEKSINELLSSNRIALMLDGFDEVNSQQKDSILDEIINLNVKHSLQIIITSRPGTSVCNEPSIINFRVEKLIEEDILSIIEKLNSKNSSIDKEQLPKIKETIKKNHNLVSVMKSPILVTLFHVCYPYMDIIPNNTVEFYSNLFMTLYLRHDKVKNFDREKSSSLSHNDAYDCFCILCFYSIYTNNHEFTEQSLYEYTAKSMQLKGKTDECKPEALALDFINVTCLIQKEGFNKYIYIHKSIQEYHAADFIKTVSSDKKNKFYNFITEDIIKNDLRFSNVVSFLKEIDEIDCAKFLTIPLCNHFGVARWDKLSHLEYKDLFLSFFSDIYIHLIRNDDEFEVMGFSLPSGFNSWMHILDINFFNEIYTSAFEAFTRKPFSSINEINYIATQNHNNSKISFVKAMMLLGLENEMLELFIKNIHKIHNDIYLNALNKVKNENSSIKEIFDLI